MKKLFCAVISVLMMVLTLVPASAIKGVNVTSSTPVIYISGDSQPLAYTDDDGNVGEFAINKLSNLLNRDEESGEVSGVGEATFNILAPAIFEGVLADKWDRYYDAIFNEINDITKDIQMNHDGTAKPGSGLTEYEKQFNAESAIIKRTDENGRYTQEGCRFFYDWRLDPRQLADDLNAYIEGVKKATGSDQVCISAKCLGCNVLMCYIDKYGTESLKGVGINVATSMGAEFLSGMISGKFGVDGNSISRFLVDYTTNDGEFNDTIKLVCSILDLLENTGVMDGMNTAARNLIYEKIEYGVISAISRSFLMTYPCYWALITEDDFDGAIDRVFGKKGDPKREEYAGLIENITSYNNEVKPRIKDIYSTLSDNGVNVCIVSKYGKQMLPFRNDGGLIGDEYCSAYSSSLGATTAKINSTLSASYIAGQKEKGLGRYISPDKQIDASTCVFPDYTWFFKGLMHVSDTTFENDLIMTVIDADHQITVNELEEYPQFIVYDIETDSIAAMTEDNCHNEIWMSTSTPDESLNHSKAGKLYKFISSLLYTLKYLFGCIFAKFA